MIKPIETHYAGCRFRSRLEARWAVFFDALHIEWEYEPEGYPIGEHGYLPDFLLPQCGTWIEVKPTLNLKLIHNLTITATNLPDMPAKPNCERGPRFMILGPIPTPVPKHEGDYGWPAFYADTQTWAQAGFGTFHKNNRPWFFCFEDPFAFPGFDELEPATSAYRAARSARFEHGESG